MIISRLHLLWHRCPSADYGGSNLEIIMPRLSENARWQAMGMLDAGMTINQTAREMGVHKKTIRRWKNRRQLGGNLKDLPRSGRPRVTSANQDASIINHAERKRRLTGK